MSDKQQDQLESVNLTEAEELAQEAVLFEQLFKIVSDLGWQVSIPQLGEEETVPGLIVGTKKYIDDVIAGKYANAEDKLDKQD